MSFILLFFPSIFAIFVKESLFNEKLQRKDYIYLYVKYNLIINLIAFGVLTIHSLGTPISVSYSVDNVSFSFKFLIMTIVLSCLVPIFDEYFKKNIDVKIEIRKIKEKNDSKRKVKKKKSNK